MKLNELELIIQTLSENGKRIITSQGYGQSCSKHGIASWQMHYRKGKHIPVSHLNKNATILSEISVEFKEYCITKKVEFILRGKSDLILQNQPV